MTIQELIKYWEARIKELEKIANKTGSRENELLAKGEIRAAKIFINQLNDL